MKKTTLHLAVSALLGLSALSAASIAHATDAPTDTITEEHVVIAQVQVSDLSPDATRQELREAVRAEAAAMAAKARAYAANAPTKIEVDELISRTISTAFANADGLSLSFGARVTKNAPYSADIINERTQLLNDGNQIVRRSTQSVARDSAGRTRTEVRNENGETRSIMISDPLESARYVLSPQKKSATKLNFDGNLSERVQELREKAKAMAKDGKTTLIEREPGKQVVISSVDTYPAGGDKGFREEIRVSVMTTSPSATIQQLPSGGLQILGGGGSSLGPIGVGLAELGPLNNSFQDRQWAKDATTRDLGTKSFDGVRAEGKLRSYTIPAGAIGNRNPITVSTETWFSPELQVTVYSKYTDPRSEEVVYRLSNIKRSEPSISLFTVPDGYKVTEGANVSITTKTK